MSEAYSEPDDHIRTNEQTPQVQYKKYDLKLLGLNVCGLKSKLNNDVLETYIANYDIIFLSETKVKSKYDCLQITGFNFISPPKDNVNSKFSDVLILVKCELSDYVTVIPDCMSKCVLWIKLFQIIYGAVYIPPESSPHYKGDIFDLISSDIMQLRSKYGLPICLVGDFNARTKNLPDYYTQDDINTLTDIVDFDFNISPSVQSLYDSGINIDRCNSDTKVNNSGHRLLELCKLNEIIIVNGRLGSDKFKGDFTCKGVSVIDYVLVSVDLLKCITDFEVDLFDPLLSDVHSPISLALDIERDRQLTNESECEPIRVDTLQAKWMKEKSHLYRNNFDLNQVQSLSEELENITDFSNDSINNINIKIKNLLVGPAESAGIIKKRTVSNKKSSTLSKSSKKPWFNKDCQKLRTEYTKTKNIYKRFRTTRILTELKNKSKLLKRKCRQSKLKFEKELHKSLRQQKLSNPKEFWKILSSKQNKRAPVEISLDTARQHFEQMGKEVTRSDENIVDPEAHTKDYNIDLNKDFTVEELKAAVKCIKNNKSCGVDNVLNEFIKHSPDTFIELLTKYFNIILNSGCIPEDWTLGIILPIYKNKGSPKEADNYRGITLLSCVGKLFTALLNKRLSNMVYANGIIGEEQAGFREGYSTMDHIFVLNTVIQLYLAKRKRLYCAFIDYKKAFDMINRTKLWSILLRSNINGKILTVIQNLYKHAKSCVRINHCLSDTFCCNVGLRQGENLSPLLFALYIKDFNNHISCNYNGINPFAEYTSEVPDENLDTYLKLYSLLYADDTIVLATSPEDLQKALDAAHSYCTNFDLQVNTSKTNVVVFSRGKIRNKPQFKYGQSVLEIVDSYKYLGCIFNYNGKFNKCMVNQVTLAKRAMFSVLTKSCKFNLPIDITCQLFDSLVMPILLYGSEIWGYENIEILEKFHTQFGRIVLKVHKRTPTCIVLGELGRLNIKHYIDKKIINYWCRLLDQKDVKLSKAVYLSCKRLYDKKMLNLNWLENVKLIVDNCGYSNVWYESIATVNVPWMKASIIQKIADMAQQAWLSTVNENQACITYRIIKRSFGFENYLHTHNVIERMSLCKMRTINHKLPIITGRYENTERSERLCNLCTNNEIGDEFHYIFVCNFFETERSVYLRHYYRIRPNTNKMLELFTTKNKTIMKNLAVFVNKILTHFE